VDAALAEARKAIFAQKNDVEWGTPVLYMRSPDGRIFDIKWVSEKERKSAQSAALYHEAQAAMVGEDWTTAIEKLRALLALDPAYAEAMVKLNQARQQQELATLYARGQKHYKAGRWPQALAYFRRVRDMEGDYKDVDALIMAVEREVAGEQTLPKPRATPSRLKANIPVALMLLLVVVGGGYLTLKILPSLLPSSATPKPVATFIVTPKPTAMPILTVTSSPSTLDLKAQQVGWGPAFYEREAGICVNNCAEFIPWVELKEELQQQLLPQVSRIPSGSTVTLKDSQEKQDWIVQVVNQNGDEIGNIWFGTDPYNDWAFDGLVRVGSSSHPVVVWDAFQRHSDGSYRRQITPTYTPISTPEEMIHIPAGNFIQGLTDIQIDAAYQDCIESELPQYVKALCRPRTSEKYRPNVYLDEFYIDKHEVTNAQYSACAKARFCNPHSPMSSNTRSSYFGDPRYADYPVIYVTWYNANTYCQWMGKRLPTEAEWEKAARGENGMLWPWGNSFSQGRAQIRPGKMEPDTSDTIRVGSYPGGASPYGAMDMVGNVTEWVADWYNKEYYDGAPTRNPEGPPSGEEKVIRGGSWNSNAYSARPSARASAPPSKGYFDIGFRCAQ
jgi:formylglycine-generating enzyme required for sulfatase activity/tetratricopeptide (TPR) repeat protein